NEQNKKADPIRSAFGNILFLWLHRYSTSHSFIRLSFYSLSTRLSGRPLQEIAPALLPAHQPARRRDTRALGFDMRMRTQHLLHDVLLTAIDIDQQQVFAGTQGILKPAELRVGYLNTEQPAFPCKKAEQDNRQHREGHPADAFRQSAEIRQQDRHRGNHKTDQRTDFSGVDNVLPQQGMHFVEMVLADAGIILAEHMDLRPQHAARQQLALDQLQIIEIILDKKIALHWIPPAEIYRAINQAMNIIRLIANAHILVLQGEKELAHWGM